MNGLTIGPFSFSIGLLTTFAAIATVLGVGNLVGRARGVATEGRLWVVIIAAMLAARIAYVALYAKFYAASPMSMLDVRDGGFNLIAGLGAGLATAALLAWKIRDQRRPVLAGAGAGAAVFALAALVASIIPKPAIALPAMTLARLDGGTLALAAAAGKPVVLNLWASWCGPCRREMPVLRQAQIDHPEITFIFINQGETPAQIRAYLREQGITLDNVLLDARPGVAGLLGSKALPSTFFFNRKGALVERRLGEMSAATLSERLASSL